MTSDSESWTSEITTTVANTQTNNEEDAADADAARLATVFDAFDLQQHVVGPTHNLGGTLDIVATFSDYRVDSADGESVTLVSVNNNEKC